MGEQPLFSQSFAVFDADQYLVDWTPGFAEEFADAAPLLVRGISAQDIFAACLLPERALDLSWAASGSKPHAFEYINSRQTVSVTQELSVSGCILRFAQSTKTVAQLHPSMLDDSTELLRSTALQISASVRKQREAETARLNELALTDGLTGVANRRYFDEVLNKEWQRCKRSRLPLSVIFVDIDFFKRYNDYYGHNYGDVCLKSIAAALKGCVNRPGDLLARIGGEEFVCLLPETGLAGSEDKAKKLEWTVRSLAIPHAKSGLVPVVTISVGVATVELINGDDAYALVNAADQQLYAAKADGRGCVRSIVFREA